MEFYISNNNEKEGPFTLEELSAKDITPHTLVWAVGYKEWKAAKDVPELNDIIYKTPPAQASFSTKSKVQVLKEVKTCQLPNYGYICKTNLLSPKIGRHKFYSLL